MSNNKERPKLIPKVKADDGHRNSAKGGLKRRLSNEDISTKRTQQKSDVKYKNSAAKRLAQLRDNIKSSTPPSTSKQPTSQSVPESPKHKRFKIPKKTVNDRLTIDKDSNLQKNTDPEKNISPTSPLKNSCLEKSVNKLKRKSSDQPNISPLKRLRHITSSYNSKADCEVAPVQSKDDSQTSFRLSQDFIVVSDASDNECSPQILTPRLNIIRRRDRYSSGSSDKTLTPGSPNNSVDFKTPLGPVSKVRNLSSKIILNRNIFNEKIRNTVQNEAKNIFASTTTKSVQRDVQYKKQQSPTKNIFGAQVYTDNKTNNIFATKISSPTNNNTIVGQSNSDSIVQTKSSIFDRSLRKEIIHSIEKPKKEVFPPPKEENNGNKYRRSATDRLEKIRNNETQSSSKPTYEVQSPKNSLESPPKENRNIFKEKNRNTVQTETINIFASTTKKEQQSPTKNIFGAQVYTDNKSNNIFATVQSSPTNNTTFVGQSNSDGIVQKKGGIFDRPLTQERINSIDKPAEEVCPPPKEEKNSNKYSKSVTARLEKIRNNETQRSSRPSNEVQPLRNPFESPPIEKEIKPRLSRIQAISKGFQTQNWVINSQGSSRDMDTTMSDSLVVNVDDSILNKSELADPIEDLSMEWDSVPQSSEAPIQVAPPVEDKTKENAICIVTDTNVFMHFLYKVKDILNMKKSGPQKVKIYVPWMVLKELDHLKDHSGEPTRSIALTAEKFINKCLMESDSQLLGQSVHEVALQDDIGTTPDDKILSCCMQVAEKYKSVILLTNDVNLRNKALVSQVETVTPQTILSKLNPMLSKKVKFLEIRNKLATSWSMIICDCAKEAFGETYKKMDMLQNPPWSMVECVKRFRKYWGTVFRQILLKQFKKSIDEIYDFLVKHKDDIIDDSDLFNEFMKKVVEVMVFLKDLSLHKNSIKKTLEEIVEVASRMERSDLILKAMLSLYRKPDAMK